MIIKCIGNGQVDQLNMNSLVGALNCMHDQQAVMVGGGDEMDEPVMMSDRKGHSGITEDGTSTTLTAQEKDRPMVETSIVRRLTPKECERLQGMPDDWSRWGVNEKGEVYELPDSARYKLQGNGIATPFWRWLMRRISAQYVGAPTLGSLFDGQGSFPMIWESINGKGSALWSSEIEKHAIAVCKYHFPEEGTNEHTDIDTEEAEDAEVMYYPQVDGITPTVITIDKEADDDER